MKRFAPLCLAPSLALLLVPLMLFYLALPLSPALVSLFLRWGGPLGCLIIPLLGSAKGLSPYLTFFPPLVCALLPALLLRLPPGGLAPLMCFLFSVLSASTGREIYIRKTNA